jgi:hypothetical protein
MAGEKEIIFARLREYHAHELPADFADKKLDGLKSEFETLSDMVVSRMLSFVAGKNMFVDSTHELAAFYEKIKNLALTGKKAEEKNVFLSRVDELSAIASFTKTCSFRMKVKAAAH